MQVENVMIGMTTLSLEIPRGGLLNSSWDDLIVNKRHRY